MAQQLTQFVYGKNGMDGACINSQTCGVLNEYFENNYHADITDGKFGFLPEPCRSLELQMKLCQEHIELLNVNCRWLYVSLDLRREGCLPFSSPHLVGSPPLCSPLPNNSLSLNPHRVSVTSDSPTPWSPRLGTAHFPQ
ncbi:hypothetical protein DEU56DRAFT_793222 [Suillus clintonianus]|uniref:uncharacterized protein n=1 Tax=Suillus clintonianus TaxID=1904413 RepID=UPI001B875D81|nr:uncharacterized protein DEU56DRAFT_793222 [Suillus clintonianus]KAG2143050.1 hypothetical protein DEU56DRAFT_793222 [Suillus clintonianus]